MEQKSGELTTKAMQMIVAMTDDEYAALSAAAARTGKPLETLIHEALLPQLQLTPPPPQIRNELEFAAYLLHQGHIAGLPTHEAQSPVEIAAREQLARKLAHIKPLSEIVIEDRGPKV